MEKTQDSTQAELHWYAMKVFYNKVFEMEGLLEDCGIESYIATIAVEQKGKEHSAAAKRLADESDPKSQRMFFRSGPMIFKRVPVVNSLLFLHTDDEHARAAAQMISKEGERNAKGFIYSDRDKKGFCIIPDRQMEIFRLVVSSGEKGLEFFSEEALTRFKRGDKVRVLEGPLAGAEGYIKRIGKDRRLLVSIEGVIAVATSYIPRQMLEKVEE